MKNSNKLIIASGVDLGMSGLIAVTTYCKSMYRSSNTAFAASDQLPVQDPRLAFPVAPTTMTTETHHQLAAQSARYTVEAAMPEPGVTRTTDEQKKLEELASRLEKLAPVPNERRAHFAWMENADSPVQFKNWGCLLQEAKPASGGWTLRVIAMARATDSSGQHIDVFNRFIEEYTLTESGKLQLNQGHPHPDDPGQPRFGRSGL